VNDRFHGARMAYIAVGVIILGVIGVRQVWQGLEEVSPHRIIAGSVVLWVAWLVSGEGSHTRL